MTDAELLDEVLTKDLPDDVREAFEGMCQGLHKWHSLSHKQRAWVESVARAHGIEVAAPAENLVSSGKMLVTAKERASLAAFHQSLGTLPKKPPGRR